MMSSDPEKEDLVSYACGTCKNEFWTENLPLHRPEWCPFCGVWFETIAFVDADAPAQE